MINHLAKLICTVAHKTVPMFSCFGQMDLVWSDDVIQGSGSHVQQTTPSWLMEHLRSCDLDKNSWSNEQNSIGTHWDR